MKLSGTFNHVAAGWNDKGDFLVLYFGNHVLDNTISLFSGQLGDASRINGLLLARKLRDELDAILTRYDQPAGPALVEEASIAVTAVVAEQV